MSCAFMLSGWARAMGTEFDAGMAALELEYPRASAIGPYFRYYATLLADGYAKGGRASDALPILRQAIDTITEPGVGFYISELYRLQGICLLRTDPSKQDEAMNSLRTAVDVARTQRATLLELRAATSLARASIEIGLPAEGLEPLRDLCAALPAEFDATSLVEAQQLLSR